MMPETNSIAVVVCVGVAVVASLEEVVSSWMIYGVIWIYWIVCIDATSDAGLSWDVSFSYLVLLFTTMKGDVVMANYYCILFIIATTK